MARVYGVVCQRRNRWHPFLVTGQGLANLACHREGPPRYYLPVCVLTPLGFMGGPCGYQEVGEDELGRGNVIIVKDSND